MTLQDNHCQIGANYSDRRNAVGKQNPDARAYIVQDIASQHDQGVIEHNGNCTCGCRIDQTIPFSIPYQNDPTVRQQFNDILVCTFCGNIRMSKEGLKALKGEK